MRIVETRQTDPLISVGFVKVYNSKIIVYDFEIIVYDFENFERQVKIAFKSRF